MRGECSHATSHDCYLITDHVTSVVN
ncbi:MAG: hypothetical protein ACJA09_001320 [Alcanivorax sp.]